MCGWWERLRPVLFLLALAPTVVATAIHAQAPAPTPPPRTLEDRVLTPQQSDHLMDEMNTASGFRLYEGLCVRARDYVTKKGTAGDPLLSQAHFKTTIGAEVLRSLFEYCSTGRFILAFYDVEGNCKLK